MSYTGTVPRAPPPTSASRSSIGGGHDANLSMASSMAEPAKYGKDLYVRIASVLNPAKYWVSPLPLAQSGQTVVSEDSPLGKVFSLEACLGRMYNDQPIRIQSEGQLTDKDMKVGMLVAVRSSFQSRCWHRGKIIFVIHTKVDVLVRIFLIDYGDVWERLSARMCVRKLPKRMMPVTSRPLTVAARPLAFQVVLAGLRPISWEINFDIGMKTIGQTIAPKWSKASEDLVYDILKKSPNKLAKVTHWQKDRSGRLHGRLELLGFKKRLLLDQLLLSQNHAVFYENLFCSDLKTKSTLPVVPRFTSICGPGPAAGTITFDESFDFASDDREFDQELMKHTSFQEEAEEEPKHPTAWKSFVPEEKLLRERQKKAKKKLKEASATASVRSAAVLSNMSSLARLKVRCGTKSIDDSVMSQDSSSFWDQYRVKVESDSDDETEEEKTRRKNREEQKKLLKARQLVVPAGIDLGKFLEEQLKRVPTPIIGPKKILPLVQQQNRES